MRKSKRSTRRTILIELLNHLKSQYDVKLTPDLIREVINSNAGVDALLSFRSDSRLDELRGALLRLESGTFGICIACREPIAQIQLDGDVTSRVCPSCESNFNHRRPEAKVAASSPQAGILHSN
jgi:RNA polymerase-binding transcription factor DksA